MFGTQLVTPVANYMISILLNTVLKNGPSFSSFTATEIAPEGIEVKLEIRLPQNLAKLVFKELVIVFHEG